jgi:hypothetical protein
LYDFGWGDITFTMNFTSADPSQWSITIPLQPTGGTGSGNPTYVRGTVGGVNTFNSCEQTFTVTLDLMSSTTAVMAGGAGYQFRLAK